MRFDTGQHMRIEQRMKLSPRMIQSMEILQMPTAALEERIEQELSENPTLEMREGGPDADELQAERDQDKRDDSEGERDLVVSDDNGSDKDQKDDFERLTNLSEEYGESWESNTYETGTSYRKTQYDGERDGKIDAMANTAARPQSLHEQLLEQWMLAEAPPEIDEAGQYIIEYIDDDGYIRSDIEAIMNQAPRGITKEQIEEAIDWLQQNLEPVGIGARDLRECLLLQIDNRVRNNPAVDLTTERLLVSEYLEEIEKNRLPRIAKETDLSIDQIKAGITSLRQFHPHPGRMLVADTPHHVTPDARVYYDDQIDRYMVELTRGQFPAVQVAPRYVKMERDRSVDKPTRDFVSSNLRSARDLIHAIEQRSNTLLRVVQVVVQAQQDFFDQGPQALKPLPMSTVAEQLGVHVATISRAVNEKYIETPRGIVPLRMFFTGGTTSASGEEMSWAAVQAKLKEIIDAEDKSKPLSDDALVDELKKHGIEIARRTVAKYRSQLNIPSARQRKEY